MAKHMHFSGGGERYQQIIIESFMPASSSGHRTEVLLRPLPGQIFAQDMLVEASREMRDITKFPLNTKFVVNVCVKQKVGCRPHLYCNWRDPIVLADEEARDPTRRPERELAAPKKKGNFGRVPKQLECVSTTVDSEDPDYRHSTPIPKGDVDAHTSKQVLAQARLGQGEFREMVLGLWGGRCALTGVSIKTVIIASHIKPWSFSTNQERLDPYNGLPLAASVDRLFESGLIAFADDGTVLVRSTTVRSELAGLGVLPGAQLQRLHPAHLKYIEQHRKRHGFA